MAGSPRLLLGICRAAVRRMPVDGAAVAAITSEGHQGSLCATDQVAAALEESQFDLGEGPAIDAFGQRRPVFVPDLMGVGQPGDIRPAERWPAFVPAALELQVRAVFAFPMLLGAAELGALLLYARDPGDLDARARAVALGLADTAAVAALDQLHGLDGAGLDGAGLDGAGLDGRHDDFFRSEVYQAAGMTMVQLGITVEAALARIRAHAYTNQVPVSEIARAIVRRELRLPRDT